MLLNFAISLIEAVGGVLFGSLSLISDALHNFSDDARRRVEWKERKLILKDMPGNELD
jgi:hypothetical protein